jgi:opacity protein-like surface antigen
MRLGLRMCVAAAALVWVLAPSQARAEGFFAPWAGVNFGSGVGDLNFNDDVSEGRASFGVSAGSMGAGVIGGEFDFGYSPSFFGTENEFGSNTVITAMGNLIIGIPIGGTSGPGIRPYVTGGLGLIRTQIDGGTVAQVESSNNEFGYNLGAGVMGYFNDHVGLRGDLRYFRWLQEDDASGIDFDLGTFHFWRASIGVVIR